MGHLCILKLIVSWTQQDWTATKCLVLSRYGWNVIVLVPFNPFGKLGRGIGVEKKFIPGQIPAQLYHCLTWAV